jgi:membrane protein required for colicin V production
MLTAFDYVVLAIVVLSALQGMWRGLVAELFALIGWIAALAVAVHYMGWLAAWLPKGLPGGEATRLALAFVLLVVVVLIGAGLAATLFGKLTEMIGLRALDQSLGIVFGALRGAVLVVIGVILASYTPLPAQPFWRQARLLPYAEDGVRYVRQCLPPGLRQYVPLEPGAAQPSAPDDPDEGQDGRPGRGQGGQQI